MTVLETISAAFAEYQPGAEAIIDKLPQSGSDRMYFRVKFEDTRSVIATYNNNIKENDTFLNFSAHFRKCGCHVPEVYFINTQRNVYFQQDFGDLSLLNILETEGYSKRVYELFKKSLKGLAHLQIQGDKGFNYDWCITSREFGKQAIMADLLYFKYYFLDTLKIPYDKEKLIDDFEALSNYLSHVTNKFFMFRDFQSRNIMVQGDEVFFIDFQGGMKGAPQYDVASLLWQAKANLSDEWKTSLLDYYIDCVDEQVDKKTDRLRFTGQYHGYVLIRLLQVLGAYGFRGLFERKAHFLTSIPLALRNLSWFLENKQTGISLPEFETLLDKIVQDNIIHRFEPDRATKETPLTVKINSFSFIKRGYPSDESGNGGGFVFDCRSILNPGRIDEYKTQTGRDKPVIDFLEQRTLMSEFLNNAYNIVDIAVEDYMRRGFESLMINFGCTGGQHRSVYAAEQMARHLRNKYGVRIILNHLEQGIEEIKEPLA